MSRLGRYSVLAAVTGIALAFLLVVPNAGGAATGDDRLPPPQSGRNGEPPPYWQAIPLLAEGGERAVEVMRPGWHIHPGAATMYVDSRTLALGNFSLSSTIFLFPAGSGEPASRVDSAYGVAFGMGFPIDGPWIYYSFQVRNDGMFQVAHHRGADTEAIQPWTAHDAIAGWRPGDQGTAQNVLSIDATDDTVTFWVNDQLVVSLQRARVKVDGAAGVIAGDGLNLHVSELAIGPNR